MRVLREITDNNYKVEYIVKDKLIKEKSISIVCNGKLANKLFSVGVEEKLSIISDIINNDSEYVVSRHNSLITISNAKHSNGTYKSLDDNVIIVTEGNKLTKEDYDCFGATNLLYIFEETANTEFVKFNYFLEFGEGH